ncbi:hypothetical protein CSKR_109095 [Clonorchis sinensis]|uniref:Uncharacterized protein n=1 Tax=Clonorchis sinensis TaxID=79923 RepID=A0A419PV96_CLOSI|nr:hypothetical protein CSKR_109095 [Clonorchis sinensis]
MERNTLNGGACTPVYVLRAELVSLWAHGFTDSQSDTQDRGFFPSFPGRRWLDRALQGLERVWWQQLLSNQFVGVQQALGIQLRLARITGWLSVEELVHLARELAEVPLATFQSQEKRDDSPERNLRTQVDRLAEQLAALKTESQRHVRKSRCYDYGMPGYWKNQCCPTQPLGGEIAQRLERERTDRKVRGSNPVSASRLPLSRLGQPGSIPALVLPSGGMAARHRKGATADWSTRLGNMSVQRVQT